MNEETGCKKALCLVPFLCPRPISCSSLLNKPQHAQLWILYLHYPRKQEKRGGYCVQCSLRLCCITHRYATVCTMSPPDKYVWNLKKLAQRRGGVYGFQLWRKSERERWKGVFSKKHSHPRVAILLPRPTNCFLKVTIVVHCSGTTAHCVVLCLEKHRNMVLLLCSQLRSFTCGKNIQLHSIRWLISHSLLHTHKLPRLCMLYTLTFYAMIVAPLLRVLACACQVLRRRLRRFHVCWGDVLRRFQQLFFNCCTRTRRS